MRSHRLKERLQQAADAIGIGRTTVAETLDVSRSAVDSWFSGSRSPDLRTIERLAVVLQTTPSWLAFGVSASAPEAPDASAETAREGA
jgi:transcriptional regulator with XRE-family HTH domain